jgi:hypothetical protein
MKPELIVFDNGVARLGGNVVLLLEVVAAITNQTVDELENLLHGQCLEVHEINGFRLIDSDAFAQVAAICEPDVFARIVSLGSYCLALEIGGCTLTAKYESKPKQEENKSYDEYYKAIDGTP